MLMVLYGTGMRRAEIARLKIADIDSQRMIIHVVDGKGHKDRDLPLSPALLETLRAHWRWLKPRTYPFPSRLHRDRERPITDKLKAFRAVSRCRTAARGGHKDKCVNCQFEAPISYNSCRSRCCPKCQARARRQWLEAQQRDLLNTNYFHVVFTLPHELNPLALTTPKPFFDLLFEASSQALLQVAADPKRLGAEIGFLSVLHTWSQNLLGHYHVHSVVPAGGLSPDHQRWIPTSHPLFLVPIPTLRTVFREKFLAGLRQLYRKDMLDLTGPAAAFSDHASFEQLMEKLDKKNWFVYAKPPFGGPEHVLRYLGRYTHRMAISNHRLTAFDGEHVSFRWQDYAHGSK